MTDGFNYFAAELKKTDDPGDYGPGEMVHQVKVRGGNGETRWMGLFPAEYDRLRDFLVKLYAERD
jgi:hypothetical protein